MKTVLKVISNVAIPVNQSLTIGVVMINVSAEQLSAKDYAPLDTSHVELKVVSKIPLYTRKGIGPVETNVLKAQGNVRACVATGTLLVEHIIVSRILHLIRIHIGLVEKSAFAAQNSVRVHVVLDIFCVVQEIADGTQPSTEITTEPVGTNV